MLGMGDAKHPAECRKLRVAGLVTEEQKLGTVVTKLFLTGAFSVCYKIGTKCRIEVYRQNLPGIHFSVKKCGVLCLDYKQNDVFKWIATLKAALPEHDRLCSSTRVRTVALISLWCQNFFFSIHVSSGCVCLRPSLPLKGAFAPRAAIVCYVRVHGHLSVIVSTHGDTVYVGYNSAAAPFVRPSVYPLVIRGFLSRFCM